METSSSTTSPSGGEFVQCEFGHYYPVRAAACPFCPGAPFPPDLSRCPFGHVYDRAKSESCPECSAIPPVPPPALSGAKKLTGILLTAALILGGAIYAWLEIASTKPKHLASPAAAPFGKEGPGPKPIPGPIVEFSSSSDSITLGRSAVLRWTVQNADSTFIDQGIGAVKNIDRRSVQPQKTTTYTLTAVWQGHSVSKSVSLIVRATPAPAAPEIDVFTAEPKVVDSGASAALIWSVRNATAISIRPLGIKSLEVRGRHEFRPNGTGSFTLTATGPGGTKTASAEIKVLPLPPPPPAKAVIESFIIDPNVIQNGQSATILWSARDATGAAISPGVGRVAASGRTTVTPAGTTTYTLRASGPGGSDDRSETLTVIVPPRPAKPLSGVLHCSDRQADRNGQVVFENLPEGTLRFNWDRTSWRLLPRRHPGGGGQDLILVPLKPLTQKGCEVTWEIVK